MFRLLTKTGGRGVPGKGKVREGSGGNCTRKVMRFWTEAFWKGKLGRRKRMVC